MSPRVRVPLLLTGAIVSIVACEKSSSQRTLNDEAVTMTATTPAPSLDGFRADSVRAVDLPARGVLGGVAVANGARTKGRASGQASAQLPAAAQEVTPGSMLVRTGQASMQVDSLELGIARIRDLARRTGSVIANTSMEGGHEQTRAASLELRIPSERFDEAVNALAPIGKVETVNVSVQDVGEEYVDVQARVANARRLEQRLIELLANRTGKLSDVLTVERELARVREEIERAEGRMRYLRTRASVSTLAIAVHEPFPIVADRPGSHPIRDAFIQSWRNVITVTSGLIAAVGIFLPLGVLVGGIAFAWRRWAPARALGLTVKPKGAASA
jgi:acetolactate synthase regulatory subunit